MRKLVLVAILIGLLTFVAVRTTAEVPNVNVGGLKVLSEN